MNPSFDLFASLLSGLGFFFAGNKLVSDNLKILTGRNFRDHVASLGANPFAAAFWGMVSGLVTWSVRATTFIVASFVHSRLIPVRQAIPIALWANAGCSLLVFAAVLPLKLLVLLLVGLSGICLALETPDHYRTTYAAIFGLAMLLFGLTVIRASAAGFSQHPWFQSHVVLLSDSLLLSFLAGAILTVLFQSHLGITLIAVALTESGLFPTADPIVMIMLGAHAGNSLNIYLQGWRFAGSSRQVIMGQVLTNAVGVMLFLGIFSIWRPAQIAQALGKWWHADIGQQAVYLTILFNVAMPALFFLIAARALSLLERGWPPLDHESIAHPAYIHTYMGGEPETAVLLAEKEQLRLLTRLPAYLDALRIDREQQGAPGPEVYHAAFTPLSEQILEFLLTVMQRDGVLETSEQLLHLQNRQRLLAIIEEDVFGLFQILKGRRGQGKAGQLGLNILESLDTLLLTVIAAAETGDAHEHELLSMITADRGSLMEQIRRNYLSLEQTASAEDRSLVLYLTHLFERTVWSIGQYGKLHARAMGSTSSRAHAPAWSIASPPPSGGHHPLP